MLGADHGPRFGEKVWIRMKRWTVVRRERSINSGAHEREGGRALDIRGYLWEGFQQRLGRPQIGRVKPFAERTIDLGQRLVGFCPLALPGPQPGQAHRRPQLEELGPSLLGFAYGRLEAGLGLICGRGLALVQQLPFQPVEFGAVGRADFDRQGQPLFHRGQRFVPGAAVLQRLGQ